MVAPSGSTPQVAANSANAAIGITPAHPSTRAERGI